MIQIVGWAGFIRVDGTAYNFLGTPGLDAGVLKTTQKSFKVLLSGPLPIYQKHLTDKFLSSILLLKALLCFPQALLISPPTS